MKKSLIALISLALLLSPLVTLAAEFDPNYLISDSEITNYSSMTQADIDEFLRGQEGTLKNYITIDKEDNFKTATQTFYEVANKWMINPKYLLTLVQKEMGLLADTSPKQSQYDWATGYGCPDGQGCDTKYKGFYKQVNSAAAQTRYYMDNINEYHYRPGRTYTIDGVRVTIENTATAGLYTYTPHIHGNELFWDLWNKYFGKKWPDGALLRSTDNDKVYYIFNSKKREITSNAILLSRFDNTKVVEVEETDLDNYDSGVPIKYYNFSFVSTNPTSESSAVYMVVDDALRRFENRELFTKTGFQEDEIVKITSSELNTFETGSNITKYTLYPQGVLLRDDTNDELYYVINGRKKLVVNDEILEFNFDGMPVEIEAHAKIKKYRTGNPVTLPDGELIKTKGVNTVYVISKGKAMPIYSGEVFHSMNYKWDNVVIISDATLTVHPLGQTITGTW
jgi:hypothetical protein